MSHRILVVDDEVKICEILDAFLTDNGFEVFTAQNAEDAFSVLDNEKLDLLILDKNLKGSGDEGIYRDIRARGINIPIIAVTSSRKMSVCEEDIETPQFADFLFKPVDLNDLLKSVNKVLGVTAK